MVWDVDLLSGYRYWIAKPGLKLSDLTFWSRQAPCILARVEAERPDWILVYGYSSRMNWQVLRYAGRRRIPILYASDTNIRIEGALGVTKGLIKSVVVGTFFRGVSRFLAPGNNNREYLLKHGAPADRITWSPFAIEVQRFHSSIQDRDRTYDFLWAGKFIRRKRCQDFLAALAELERRGLQFRALLIGDGPLLESISSIAWPLVRSGKLDQRGFSNQSEMPRLLGSARSLVFTSESEPYGLIATEAAAAGCALVVADGIGCLDEKGSAQSGRNALAYPCGNVAELADAMHQLLADSTKRRSMQEASVLIAKDHDVSKAAGIIESVVLGNALSSW